MNEEIRLRDKLGVMTVKDIQIALGVGKDTAYEIINDVRLESFKLGGKLFVSVENLKKYLEMQ